MSIIVRPKGMKLADLREAIEGLPDDTPVAIYNETKREKCFIVIADEKVVKIFASAKS